MPLKRTWSRHYFKLIQLHRVVYFVAFEVHRRSRCASKTEVVPKTYISLYRDFKYMYYVDPYSYFLSKIFSFIIGYPHF